MPANTRRLRARLCFERLEDRTNPATISFLNGNLSVTNNTGVVAITQNAGGAFTVQDGAKVYGIYMVTNNLSVQLSNNNDSITVALAAGEYLPGTLSINGLNGNDTIVVTGAGSGRIGANLSINVSNGNDRVYLGRTSAGVNSGLDVSGATIIAGGAGLDTLDIGDGSFDNSMSLSQINMFDIGKGGGTATVAGNLTLDNSADQSATNTARFEAGSTVAANLKYVGGVGDDSISLEGIACVVPGRGVSMDTAYGNSTFNLSGTIGDSVLATLSFKGSNNTVAGADSVTFAATAVVTSNATLLMGNGANYFNLANNFFVGGNFTISAGSNADNVGAIDGVINGDVNVSLGSGNDTVSFGTFGLGVGAINGNLYVDMGAGNDSVDLNVAVGGGTGTVAVFLGAGADTFNAVDPAFSSYGAATIDLGLDANSDKSSVLLALSPFTTHVNVGGGDLLATV